MLTIIVAPFCPRGWHSYKCHYTYPVAYFQGCATSINSWGPMNYNCVTQPFTARHVRFTKKLGFGSLGISNISLHTFSQNQHRSIFSTLRDYLIGRLTSNILIYFSYFVWILASPCFKVHWIYIRRFYLYYMRFSRLWFLWLFLLLTIANRLMRNSIDAVFSGSVSLTKTS